MNNNASDMIAQNRCKSHKTRASVIKTLEQWAKKEPLSATTEDEFCTILGGQMTKSGMIVPDRIGW